MVVLWLVVHSAAGEVSPEVYGLPVGEIDFDSPVPIDREDFLRELPLRQGQPLTAEGIARAVEWLRDKETFSFVDANGTILDGRAAVIRFRLVPIEVVVGVEIRGAKALDDAELQRRARIREDEPLSGDKVSSVIERLRTLYKEHGYPDVHVQVVTLPVRPGQSRVRILVEEGKPVRIEAVELVGLETPEGEASQPVLPFREGDVFAEDRLEAGRNALLRWLRKRAYFEADVNATVSVTDKTARLRYEARLGPRFEIEIKGNTRISSEQLLNLSDLTSRPIVTAGTWRLLALRMQQLYREEGYHFAGVGVATTGRDPKRVTFEVREGDLLRVESVSFRGNQVLSARDLWHVMQTRAASRFSFLRRMAVFREEVFADDLEQIRRRYHDAGYLDAEIRDVVYDFKDDRRRVRLTVEIHEGFRSVVGSVKVLGVEGSLTDPLVGLRLREGVPYRSDVAEEDRRHLLSRLGAQGYPDAEIALETSAQGERRREKVVDVRFRVLPGERARIGRIVIRQNYFTRDSVVRRELPFRSGDFLDPAALSLSQTKIYRLGLFRSVAIRPAQPSGAERDVLVQVGERPGGEVQYGFGYNTRAGLRNFFQVAHRNILGTGRQLSLRGDLNLAPTNLAPDEYVANLGGREPHFAASNYDLRANIVYERSERAVDEFSIRRFSFSTGFEREFIRGLQGSLLLEFEDSDIFDVAADAVLTGQDLGRLRTVSLNPIVVYDGRDDAFAPTRGTFDTVRVRYGSPTLGSEVHFVKLVGQHSQYVPLTRGLTWIYATRIGVSEPLGGSTTIPLRERFFLGGRTSVRGFEENSIGPRGVAGNPVGGDLLFSANSELRFPLIWGLGGAGFIDGGGLYLRRRAISFGDFRRAAGPGLRYQTPIGAISLDYGFKLDQRRGESNGEIHFTIGNIF